MPTDSSLPPHFPRSHSEQSDEGHLEDNQVRAIALLELTKGIPDPAHAIKMARRVIATTLQLVRDLRDQPETLVQDLAEGIQDMQEALAALSPADSERGEG